MGLTAKIEQRSYYEVRGESEKNEGRGGTYLVGYFATESIAKRASQGHGVMGYEGHVRPHCGLVAVYIDPQTNREVIRPLGDVIEVQYEDPVEVRKRALAKLTPEEKLALGLK